MGKTKDRFLLRLSPERRQAAETLRLRLNVKSLNEAIGLAVEMALASDLISSFPKSDVTSPEISEVFVDSGPLTCEINVPTYTVLEGKKKPKKKEVAEVPSILDNVKFHTAWEMYLDHRRANRWSKLKPQSEMVQFKRLAKYAEEWGLDGAVECITETIAQGWQGIFTDKPPRMKHPVNTAKEDYDGAALDI